ncbi:hypothetical protein [Cohnella nanjingensis]|uniref:Uncharacterized protein n=1 Tax=Cohnella nanjingensis TaxID=1387779 RepID=A0A7X0RVR2_9BACL|nr:hypothetical protein [Cohnella nanjingensis]MBB6672994.1 hypothetical protein [Cohnella nanjingensis]
MDKRLMAQLRDSHVVIKRDDLSHLTKLERGALALVMESVARYRIESGKRPNHRYLVINTDEPYAEDIVDILRANGHWEDGQAGRPRVSRADIYWDALNEVRQLTAGHEGEPFDCIGATAEYALAITEPAAAAREYLRLSNVERGLQDYQNIMPSGATAKDVFAWIESTTGYRSAMEDLPES